MRATVLVVLALLAGCVAAPPPADEPPAPDASVDGLMTLDAAGATVHSIGARANLSHLHVAAGAAKVAFPAGVLVQGEDGRLLPAEGEVEVAEGASVAYLPPYGATNLTVTINGADHELRLAGSGANALFSGDLVLDLMRVQRDHFPHRDEGQPSFAASVAYFVAFFEELGYDVVLDDYSAVPVPPQGVLGETGPTSFTAIVAYKRGSMTPERYLMYGGHFDMVPGTRDAAFDNTGGTVATMAMAKAFQNVTMQHTVGFALWAGEEDGILGSQAWVTRHADMLPFIDGYYNFDVTPLAWPAPKVDPSPLLVAAGPDGPVADELHGYAREVHDTWMAIDGEFQYEAVGQGQAQGAGVNAQSDHTPFMSRGIPVYFAFTSKVDDVFAIIHSEVDTLENLTKYALGGVEALANEIPLAPEEVAEGEWYLARSFETNMALGFYWAVLTDAGVFGVPTKPVPGTIDLARAG